MHVKVIPSLSGYRSWTVVCAIAVLMFVPKAHSDVIIKTRLPQDNLVADGNTVYLLEVRANTMQYPGVRFAGSEWRVNIPSLFTVVGAELPDPNAPPQGPSTNPDDFYFQQLPDFDGTMFDNSVDPGPYPFVGGGVLSNNHRSTDNVFTGPSDLNDKLLGRYFVKVNLGTMPQAGTFDLNTVVFFDTPSFNAYYSPDAGSGVSVQNDAYRIMPRKADVNGDGAVDAADISAFTTALLGNPTLQTGENYAGEYCDWSGNDDGQLNGRDIQSFVANYLLNG